MSDEKEKAILIYELLKDIKQEETKSINELNPISNYVSSANYTYMKSNSYEDMILEIMIEIPNMDPLVVRSFLGEGYLDNPVSLDFGNDGWLYVLDREDNSLRIFNSAF